MSKFNTPTARATGTSVIETKPVATAINHQGGAGFERTELSELFLLAVTNLVGEQTFYETAGDRDSRFETLITKVASVEENIVWLTAFAIWLRGSANMRSASLVLAAETVRTRLKAGFAGGNREIINGVLQRPDEPGEMLAYWTSRYGRAIPKPVKRGIADAASRMYNQKSFLKYDGNSHAYGFQDVIALTHPEPLTVGRSPAMTAAVQSDLFEYIALNRIGAAGRELVGSKLAEVDGELVIPESLAVLRANKKLRTLTPEQIHKLAGSGKLADCLKDAGMTWENIPALVNGPWTKDLWEAIIPSMGYMALLRNLKNFDENGVSDEVAASVAARLADPEEVAKSRQLPMRFLSAYNKAPSLRWAHALDKALDMSLASIPELSGNTLVLIDTSGSMHAGFSRDGSLARWDAATVFGLALARRAEKVDVVSFSGGWYGSNTDSKVFPAKKGESVLRSIERWTRDGFFINGGTDTVGALRKHYKGHDRVVILTDEQAGNRSDVSSAIPSNVPMHTYNLAGYQYGHAPSGTQNRYTSGGLTDLGFAQIPLLEKGSSADWPWVK